MANREAELSRKYLLGNRLENDRIEIAGATHDTEHDEIAIVGAEIGAEVAVNVKSESGPDPASVDAGIAEAGDAVQVGKQLGGEALGGDRTVGGNIVIDVVEVGLGRIGQNEGAGVNGGISCGCRPS